MPENEPREVHVANFLRPNTSNNFFCPTNSLKLTDFRHKTTAMTDSSFINIVLPRIGLIPSF